jgi:UDPglucose 6-dehydrogenase|tara:strand:+ start:792 stop:1970 length:1179 start_codon:yes stop_codon:yes gene_type:complete
MKNMNIGFVGVGKLGKDAAEVMARHYDVTGYDIEMVYTTIDMANTLEGACINKDIIFVALPTPHHPDYDGRYPTSHLPPKDFDYSIVKDMIAKIDRLVSADTLIVLISTVLPGTIRQQIAPLIKNGRFIYNPYLIAQGTVKQDMVSPEMIIIGTKIGGWTDDVVFLKDFYKEFVAKGTRYEIGTWEEAESIKIFYNTFISTKLALVNMIANVAEGIGHMNVDVVTDALKKSTKRIMGQGYMRAGLGDGGACHPRDNIALRSLADRLNLGYDIFDAVMLAREKQAEHMARKIVGLGHDVCILGKGFKPGVDQEAGSPAILLGHYIEGLGRKVYYDGHPLEITAPLTYVMHHHDTYKDFKFNKGSTIFDPFGKTEQSGLTNEGIIVCNYGRSRV